jgi:hypothetical protein
MNNIITYKGNQYQLITDENHVFNYTDIMDCALCDNYHTPRVGNSPKWYRQQGYINKFYSLYTPLTRKYSIEDYC